MTEVPDMIFEFGFSQFIGALREADKEAIRTHFLDLVMAKNLGRKYPPRPRVFAM
jgi:hypothetical protein